MYRRGFSTQQRAILAQPFKGRVQINRLGVDEALHGITMPQPHLLNPVNFHCGAAHTLIESRPLRFFSAPNAFPVYELTA